MAKNRSEYPSGKYEYKKKYNEKYLSQFVQIQLRVHPEEKAQIHKMAEEAGKSVSQFIYDCIFGTERKEID